MLILKNGSFFRGEIAVNGNFICVVYPKTIFIIKKQKGLLPYSGNPEKRIVFQGEIAVNGNFICVVYPKTVFIIKK